MSLVCSNGVPGGVQELVVPLPELRFQLVAGKMMAWKMMGALGGEA